MFFPFAWLTEKPDNAYHVKIKTKFQKKKKGIDTKNKIKYQLIDQASQ